MKKLNNFLVEYPLAVSIISILSSITISFLTDAILNLPPIDSIIIGFLSLISLTLIQITAYSLQLIDGLSSQLHKTAALNDLIGFQSSISKLDQEPSLKNELICIADKTEQTISSISTANPKSKVDQIFKTEIEKQLIRSKESLEQLQNGTLRVVGDEAHTLWSRVIENIEDSFFTTNIFRFKGVLLGSRSTQHLLSLQGDVAQRLKKGNFERLFIHEPDDQDEVQKIINKQKGVGIRAWSMSREKFDKLSGDGNWIEKIGSEDFTIIDKKYLYLSSIDSRTGRVLYVDLYRGGVRLSAALEFSQRIKDIEKLFMEESTNEVST